MNSIKEEYDVIVVGGGPGGSWAAKHAAEKELSVLMLEKDREIGVPVRCAEGVSEKGLHSIVDVREKWIAQRIKGIRFVAPDGTAVEPHVNQFGYILHRKIFDADLAALAVEAGAHVLTNAYVHGLIMKDGYVRGVKATHQKKDRTIQSSIVIGADGIESRVGRWAGLDTRTPLENMDACVQMTLAGIQIDPDVIELHFGERVAPEGYLWVFPKGMGIANVGLGVSGQYAKRKKPIEYLHEFIQRRFPDASVLTRVAGGVPTIPTLKNIVSNGLMLVGDAAHQANPLSGGGITNAMIAGRIAGSVAADAVRSGDVSAERLAAYQKKWLRSEGKTNERSDKIKDVVVKLTDEDLNKLAYTLNQIPDKKRTLVRIFETALIKHPRLILDAAKIFA